jgi:hypothetical protein
VCISFSDILDSILLSFRGWVGASIIASRLEPSNVSVRMIGK